MTELQRPASRLYAIAHAFLDEVVAAAAALGHPLPDRHVVTAGPPVWGCGPEVAVWVESSHGHSGDVTRTTAVPLFGHVASMLRAVVLVITITRDDPTSLDRLNDEGMAPDDPGVYGESTLITPTVDLVNALAASVYQDEPVVIAAIREAAAAGRLPDTNDWAFLDWKVVGPAGGSVASELRLVVSTDWSPPAEGS